MIPNYPNLILLPPPKGTESITEDDLRVKTSTKKQPRDAVQAFKKTPLDTPSVIAAADPKLDNKVQQCLTNDNPNQWRIIIIWVKIIGDIIQAAMIPSSHSQ